MGVYGLNANAPAGAQPVTYRLEIPAAVQAGIDDITRAICQQAAQLELHSRDGSSVRAGSLELLQKELASMSRVVTGMERKPASFMGLPLFEDPTLPPNVVDLVQPNGRRQRFLL